MSLFCCNRPIEDSFSLQVETIGDGYMLAGGIPDRTPKHADNVADMALEMLRVIESIPNPDDSEGGHLKIRTGTA